MEKFLKPIFASIFTLFVIIFLINAAFASAQTDNLDTPTPTQAQSGGNPACSGNICISISCNGGGTCSVQVGNSPTPTLAPTSTIAPTAAPTQATVQANNSQSNNNSGSGSSSSSSSSNNSTPAVLGTTTLAKTGVFETNLMNLMLLVGILVLAAGFSSYVREREV